MKCITLIRFLLTFYIVVCLTCPFSLAQQQPTLRTGYNKTYFYAIDDIAAGKLFTHKEQAPDSSYFKKLVYVQNAYSDSLPLGTGNYLKVQLDNNELAYEYFPITPWRIYVPDTKKNLIVQLLSVSNNKPVEVSNVKLGKKYMAFDNKTRVYLTTRKKEGIIAVTDNGYTFYYKLDKVKDYNPGFAQKIKRKFSKYNLRKLRDAVTFKRKKKRKLYSSYFYFNKPIYREGDSIKLKAHFLVNKDKGIWYHKPLKVYLGEAYNDDDPIYLGKTTSKRKGAGYNFGFVIRDSMDIDLDDEYTVLMKDAKGNTIGENRFKYENYELKKAVFDISLPDGKEQHKGKPFGISLTAHDENGLPVPDTRVAITLTTSHVRHIQPDQLFTPDTLWSYASKITKGEDYLIIPDSIFPLADVEYKLNAVMQNSENEYSDLQESIEYKNSPENIRLELIEDSISVIKTKEDNLKIRVYAEDRFYVNVLDTIINTSITLPVNTHASTYYAETEDDDKILEIDRESPSVVAYYQRTADSLFLSLRNPRKLPIVYHLYKNKREILKGTDKDFPFSIASKKKALYYLQLKYVWAGMTAESTNKIAPLKNEIKLKIEHPAVITPGKEVEIKIVATDFKNIPLQGLNILSYGYTSKFEKENTARLPSLGKRFKSWHTPHSFELPEDSNKKRVSLNYSFWNDKMRLDTNWAYRFLYPSSKSFAFTHIPVEDSITQVAPFVMAWGAPQPIQYVCIDDIPVYFGFVNRTMPYSFSVDTNYHQLKIRTIRKLITIDNLKFKPGYKTLFSINENHASKLFKTEPYPDSFTTKERQELAKYVMKINVSTKALKYVYLEEAQGNTQYIDLNNFHNEYGKNLELTLGPIYGHYWNFKSYKKPEHRFEYAPYQTYFFSPNFVKILSDTLHEFIPQKFNNGIADITDRVLTQQLLTQYYTAKINEERKLQSITSLNNLTTGNCNLIIAYSSDYERTYPLNLILGKPGDFNFLRVYSGNTKEINNIPPGNYRLLLVDGYNAYRQTGIIEVRKNGTNFYRIKYTDTITGANKSRINECLEKLYQEGLDEKTDIGLLMKEYINTTYTGSSGKYFGKVVDDSGEPLIGAVVAIAKTKISTMTDFDGNFEFNIPDVIAPVLTVNSVGFTEQTLIAGMEMYIKMRSGDNFLKEIVITTPYGPGTPVKEKYVGAADVISAKQIDEMSLYDLNLAVHGGVSGVQISQNYRGLEIRGQGLPGGIKTPLIVIDGAIYNGDLTTLDPSLIASINILKDTISTSLYGARGSNGVLLITTKKGSMLPEQIRKGLIQTEPVPSADMMTSGLRNRFRDDAYWQPDLVTDKQGKAVFTVKFPDDITNWRTLVFATDDKMHTGSAFGNIKSFKPLSASLHLPRFLLDKDTAWVLGKSVNYIPDTIPATTSFYKDNQLQQEHKIMLGSFHNDTIMVSSTGGNSLTLKYLLSKEDGYFDGEERSIPVHRIGTQIATGSFLALDHQDTTFTISGAGANDDSLHLSAAASLTDIVLEEIKNIEDYRYLCNEQIASKILAMLHRQNMYAALGKPFTEKEKNSVQDMVYKLLKKQNTDHRWGWWESTSTIPWISDHVLHALLEAEKMGYEQSLDLKQIAATLLFELERDTANITIPALNILKQTGAVANFEQYIRQLERKPALSINDHLALILLRMQLHLPYRTDRLKATLETDAMGNIYWADTESRVYGNEVIATVNALKIIQQDSTIHIDKQKIVNWLLQQRGIKGWRNTYESAQIIEAIAPYLPLKNNKDLKPALHLSGGLNEQVSTFPYHKVLATTAPVTVHKSGALSVYFTWYQHHWDTTHTSTGNNFRISTGFGTTQAPLSYLQAGEPVSMKVKVEVLKSADYVMIEIPIPAGCSYQEKPQPNSNHEIHREYFEDKVSIFCEQLPKGTYEYEVALLPRYQGSYTLNPAKAELMYFPVFHGRSPIRRVQIRH